MVRRLEMPALGYYGEPSEKTTTKLTAPVRFRFQPGFRFNGIYKMPNKTRQKLYFATNLIRNITEHH